MQSVMQVSEIPRLLAERHRRRLRTAIMKILIAVRNSLHVGADQAELINMSFNTGRRSARVWGVVG
jgi:hypothetical protein